MHFIEEQGQSAKVKFGLFKFKFHRLGQAVSEKEGTTHDSTFSILFMLKGLVFACRERTSLSMIFRH